ncbi:MAG: hypothetical protein JW801_01330 [Bacteroidales bacterium]|nr:hypothetical protein [Bacteroidales bacterium]
MKKTMFTLVLGMLALNLSFAGSADLFSYNSDAVNKDLQPIQELELYVAGNPTVTLAELQAEENGLISDLNLVGNSSGMSTSLSGEPALGIPGFWWGCVIGPVGILVVHLVAEDSAETKKAIWGCLASYGASALITVGYYGCMLILYGSFYAY